MSNGHRLDSVKRSLSGEGTPDTNLEAHCDLVAKPGAPAAWCTSN